MITSSAIIAMRAELRAGIEALPAIFTQNYTQGKINPSKTVKSKMGNQFLIGEASSKIFFTRVTSVDSFFALIGD